MLLIYTDLGSLMPTVPHVFACRASHRAAFMPCMCHHTTNKPLPAGQASILEVECYACSPMCRARTRQRDVMCGLLLHCQARMLLLHLLLAALVAEDFQLGAPQFEALRATLKLPPQDLVTCYRCSRSVHFRPSQALNSAKGRPRVNPLLPARLDGGRAQQRAAVMLPGR